jgi:hypothetical protein
MGDLRNKMAKRERMDALLARAKARERQPEPLPRCACGHTYQDVFGFWADGSARATAWAARP